MARIELCSNFECKHKYGCKKYCTKSHDDYKNSTDLKDECNEANNYVLFKNWKYE